MTDVNPADAADIENGSWFGTSISYWFFHQLSVRWNGSGYGSYMTDRDNFVTKQENVPSRTRLADNYLGQVLSGTVCVPLL
jgi:hypothetical protein